MRKIFLLALLISISTYAQQSGPVNSNYLIEYGIPPQILDAGLSTTLQKGAYTSEILAKRAVNGDTLSAVYKFIYDPSINDGLDIQIAVQSDSLDKKGEKQLLKLMQNTHSFSRLSRVELYDAKSLKVIEKNGDNLELSFLYDKKRLEPELKYGKNLEGRIFIEQGTLKYIKVTNNDKVNIDGRVLEKGQFERILFFERAEGIGGYYVSSGIDTYRFKLKGDMVNAKMEYYTSAYRTEGGHQLDLDVSEAPFDLSSDLDTLNGSLGWALPLFGKGAKKLGYKLPRPIGVNIFAHYQDQLLEFTGLEVGLNDGENIPLDPLFDLPRSTVDQSTLVTMAKVDVWLLPFLNIMGIYGSGTNTIKGSLFINEDLRDFLIGIGVDPSKVPDRIPVESELTAAMYGGGATLAGGVGNFNISVNYQFMISTLSEVNTKKVAHIITPNLGYMTPFGMNIMVGAQGQFYDANAIGFIELPGGDKLNYDVSFKPSVWNYSVGLYAPLSDHWEVSIQTGFGDRRSLTFVFGYRF